MSRLPFPKDALRPSLARVTRSVQLLATQRSRKVTHRGISAQKIHINKHYKTGSKKTTKTKESLASFYESSVATFSGPVKRTIVMGKSILLVVQRSK